ncbi:LPS assembly lipoprotein LptE [Bartonella sp. HY406]|uniref:LPS assembly lipoprotein LptE n=1 Tax=Bartonella sp. HY406 TaxID=2979331 RepID=UPI0021C58251|nr:LPS assembly lipoprotein LptE [Bartonella sp. HY406]UXN03276.1 LPS assembly lipoprotein LptE [Bartonella sp. HY406]
MLLSKPIIALKSITLAALMVSAITISACTVQPLYQGSNSDGSPMLNASSPMRAKLKSIEISEAGDRTTQIVRNRLIYLFNGGAGESGAPQYKLALNVSTTVLAAVRVNVGDRTDRTGRASAGTARATGTYTISDMDGKIVAKRSRSVDASFDRPRQEYANLAAEKDAIERAANELAEQLYLSVAQDMSKK